MKCKVPLHKLTFCNKEVTILDLMKVLFHSSSKDHPIKTLGTRIIQGFGKKIGICLAEWSKITSDKEEPKIALISYQIWFA